MNFYNEIDPYAAQWLRNLIAAGHIPAGVVDERSIEDITPDELRPYTQCHFFAGIAGWSHALALAGFPASRSVWTGSCPCQPFSSAGKGAGFDDQRHLWPAWFHLIRECRPSVIFGEQVASKDAEPWVDLVHADLETVGYAFGCVPFPAAGIGAPHIRDRNYWCGVSLADTDHARLEGRQGTGERAAERAAWPRGVAGGMAYTHGGHASAERQQRGGEQRQQPADGGVERVAHADGPRSLSGAFGGVHRGEESAGTRDGEPQRFGAAGQRPGPLHGFWRDADWLLCRDGKWRPVEPGTFPLVDGLPTGLGTLSPRQRELAALAGLDARSLREAKAYRLGSLRGYGNAIVPEEAAIFIESVMEVAYATNTRAKEAVRPRAAGETA